MTVASNELRARRENAAQALEDAARRHANGDASASTDLEIHSDALRVYGAAIDALDAVDRRSYCNGERSWFGDVYRRMIDRDAEASKRLDMAVDYRSTTGNFMGLIVPSTVARMADGGHSRRPVCDLLAEPLPPTGTAVYASKVTTIGTAEMQSTEETSATPTNLTTELVDLPLRTVQSASLFSFQSVHRMEPGAFDRLVAAEVIGPVNALQESEVVTGLLNQTSAGSVTVTSTSALDMLDGIAKAASVSAEAAGVGPDFVTMAPRRWKWLLANAGDRGAALTPTSVLGMRVIETPSMPLTLSTDQDRIVVGRQADTLLYEGEPSVRIQSDASSMGDQLNARVVGYRYFTELVSLRPAALVVLSGAGLANPYA